MNSDTLIINKALIEFSQLPFDVRQEISSEENMNILAELEERYKIKLSYILIMIIVGYLEKDAVEQYLVEKFSLSPFVAKKIKIEIFQKIVHRLPPHYFLQVAQKPREEMQEAKPEAPLPKTPPRDQDDRAKIILQAYMGDEKAFQKEEKEKERLKQDVGDDREALRNEFYKAVQTKNVARTIAALKLLTEMRELLPLLREDGRLKKFLSKIWREEYGEDFAQDFLNHPDQPKYVRLFLSYVLERRLGLEEKDAARVGAHIGNIFKKMGEKKYAQLTYFDMSQRVFRWLEE